MCITFMCDWSGGIILKYSFCKVDDLFFQCGALITLGSVSRVNFLRCKRCQLVELFDTYLRISLNI